MKLNITRESDTLKLNITTILRGAGFAVAVVALASSAYVIETGNVGVKKTLGDIDTEEVGPGVHFKLPLVTSIEEYSAKENQIDLENLTPKASDNLSLRDFDVTVYYTVRPDKIADLRIKYALPPSWNGAGALLPVYELVRKQARSAAYESVARVPSLELHKRRPQLETDIQASVQQSLDQADPDAINVSRVIIRSVRTDPSVEKSIQQAVAAEKQLEAKKVQVDIAKKDAEIEIARAKGIAESNRIINDSLTPEYLQHELHEAMMKFAENGAGSVVIPANMGNVQMLLPAEPLGKNSPQHVGQ